MSQQWLFLFASILQFLLWKSIVYICERRNKTKTTDKIKKFVKNNTGVIVASSVSMAVGCLFGYKIGHDKGVRAGKNDILDEIVSISCKDGLTMTNPKLGRYIFTAKKLND